MEETMMQQAAEYHHNGNDKLSPAENDEHYDATDVWFARGEWLRRLRALEQEDEAQREIERDIVACVPSDTLFYPDFLAHQQYYDDYKHVNYRYMDFGMVGDRPLLVQQDRSVGKGGLIWDAAFILGEHVVQQVQQEVTKSRLQILELGAGTGLTGLMVARSCPSSHVHMTDLPLLIPLMDTNSKEEPNVTTGVLEWGNHSSHTQTYDVILGADVVASIYDSCGLAQTIYDLSHDKTQVYLACRDRLMGSIDQFEAHMRERFDFVHRTPAQSTNRAPGVWIFQASCKRKLQ